ncbi:MAG: cobyrinic acid ac-diamide synthase [Rhodocyclaceae bacterium]|nr:cobyrinic acid ac-diamide synthase [Rhodocyclaceae bacterium]MBX3669241.1 cobyrinic acid ac-diamide synthase [Rhodocyclaceae bacterium]
MSERSEFWGRHLAAIDAEGLSTSAYAQREGLAVASLYWWRRRLQADKPQRLVTRGGGGFVPVTVASPAHVSGRAVVVAGGVRVELDRLPNPEWLAALSGALARGVR